MIDDIRVTIPGLIPTLVLAYLLVGALLWAPLNIRAGKFIEGGRKGSLVVAFAKQARYLGPLRVLVSILGAAVMWPLMVVELVNLEARYGVLAMHDDPPAAGPEDDPNWGKRP